MNEMKAEQQIAELLFLSHMSKPLKSPFFDALQNNLAYLGHDDGWYCKLYCKDQHILISILLDKLRGDIQKALVHDSSLLPDDLVECIHELSSEGLVIELEPLHYKKRAVSIKLFTVGECENMDILLNNVEQVNPIMSYEKILNSH